MKGGLLREESSTFFRWMLWRRSVERRFSPSGTDSTVLSFSFRQFASTQPLCCFHNSGECEWRSVLLRRDDRNGERGHFRARTLRTSLFRTEHKSSSASRINTTSSLRFCSINSASASISQTGSIVSSSQPSFITERQNDAAVFTSTAVSETTTHAGRRYTQRLAVKWKQQRV